MAHERIDRSLLRTYPIRERTHKVQLGHLGRLPRDNSVLGLIEAMPGVLGAQALRGFIEAVMSAHAKRKPVLAAIGGHVVKCGCSPYLIELMRRRIVTGLVMNGSTAIHDVELALIGQTSEDVAATLENGTFGMVEETGRLMNEALVDGAAQGLGAGRALGEAILKADLPHRDVSLLAAGIELDVPVTVHIAIGTDTIHQHPKADGAALGETSLKDFELLAALVAELGDGGVYMNIGSAVVLPEVFLKALTVARNLGSPVRNFTTANFDMLRHYRPGTNVVARPVQVGGTGYDFTGHHEIMLPLVTAAILEHLKKQTSRPNGAGEVLTG
ncbi:MAG: hypothetical protein JW889_02245 [Verrucomicrobia bacterium]|nr:hypothetical protein [Verrucomicrobiota bacterium]